MKIPRKAQNTIPSQDRRLVCGINAVQIAVTLGKASLVMIDSDKKNKPGITEITNLAKSKKTGIRFLPVAELTALTKERKTQGICCFAKDTPSPSAEEFYGSLTSIEDNAVVLLLDSVTDPHNFGAILRSAEATGVKAVVIEKRHSPPISDAVVSASAGATEVVPVVKVANLKDAIQKLKENGFWVSGTSEKTEKTLWEENLSGRLAVVLGSEGYGIKDSVLKKCDYLIKIPMKGVIPSLNVSVSAAIVLYEILRQRASKS